MSGRLLRTGLVSWLQPLRMIPQGVAESVAATALAMGQMAIIYPRWVQDGVEGAIR